MHTLKKFFSRKSVLAALLGLFLLSLFLLSLCIGATSIPLSSILSALFGGAADDAATRIVLYVRLPRTLAALFTGVSLAVAGAMLQAVLANPLASTGVMGINAGSGVMVLVAAVALPSAFYAKPLFAFLGAVLAAVTVYLVAVRSGAGKTTIVLSGVALSGFLTAVIDTLVTLFPAVGVDRLAFTVGGFSGVTLSGVLTAGAIIVVGLLFSLLLGFDLNVLSHGDEVAAGLGLKVKRTKFLSIVLVSLLSGAAISMGGLIGFVGLIVPHAARMLVGGDYRAVLPFSALLGGALTVTCDMIARTAFSPYELPVGILLSLIGAPFFLYLLLKGRGGGRHVKR